MTALTRAQSREVDRIATQELGVPGIVLMENAGIGAARHIQALHEDRGGEVAILCGAGNNGGDGYVVARQLFNVGIPVRLYHSRPADQLRGDAAVMRSIVDHLALPGLQISDVAQLPDAQEALARASILVDALLGTGFQGEVREPLAGVIAMLNETRRETGAHVVALDVPSGLDVDSGAAANATVRADETLTFFASKLGFAAPGAAEWTGRVFEVPIGISPECLKSRLVGL